LCRTFEYKDDVKPPRVYSSILGCLVRKHFPGFITVSKICGTQCVAWTWKHYMYAKDPEGEFDNAQQRVMDDFWVCFFDFLSWLPEKFISVSVYYYSSKADVLDQSGKIF
jgi:hypothetical protein